MGCLRLPLSADQVEPQSCHLFSVKHAQPHESRSSDRKKSDSLTIVEENTGFRVSMFVASAGSSINRVLDELQILILPISTSQFKELP